MTDLYKAIFVALLSLVVSVISYRYQFRRSRMIDFKGRMRMFYSLLKETIGLTEHAVASLQELTNSLNNNNLRMPLLAVSAYPVAKYLQEKVLSDDYFIAYTNVYVGAMESEKHYFAVKFSSVYIHTQCEQIVTMASTAYLKDNERRKKYIEQHQKTNDIIQKLYELSDENTRKYIQQIEKIGYDFVSNREDNDGYGNIDDVEFIFVEPILNLFMDGNFPKDLLPLIQLLGDMHYQYRDIKLQNDNIKDDLNELIEPLLENLETIKKSYEYLSSPQIKNLIN